MSNKLATVVVGLLFMLILSGCGAFGQAENVVSAGGDTASDVIDDAGNVVDDAIFDGSGAIDDALDGVDDIVGDLGEDVRYFVDNFDIVDPAVAQDILNTLDQAIASLDENSEEWQTLLPQLQNDIANTIQDTQAQIVNDVSRIIEETEQATQSTIGVAGAEFRCNTEFLGSKVDINKRVQTMLEQLRARWTGQDIASVIEPVFCQAVPPVIDILDIQSGATNAISIFGYDFDAITTNALDLVLVNNNGNERSVKRALNKSSDFLLTINVSSNGVPLNQNSNRLIVRYQGDDLYSFAVTQPNYQATQEAEAEATREVLATRTRQARQTRIAATATAERIETVQAQSARQTRIAATATAQYVQTEEARISAEATATWLDADSDADGWDNQRELTNGTDPNRRDTDGDGILDSQDANPLLGRADVTVRFTSVEIINDSDPGANGKGEVRISMTVNGETKCWPNCSSDTKVDPGSTHSMNKTFTIENVSESSIVNVSVTGSEFDNTSGTDSMGNLTEAHRLEEWGAAGSRNFSEKGSVGNRGGQFKIFYTITVEWKE